MVGSSMQVQNKIRFLLVAGRTQEIIRVNTKSCIWLLQAITFVSIEKLLSLLNWEEYWVDASGVKKITP